MASLLGKQTLQQLFYRLVSSSSSIDLADHLMFVFTLTSI